MEYNRIEVNKANSKQAPIYEALCKVMKGYTVSRFETQAPLPRGMYSPVYSHHTAT